MSEQERPYPEGIAWDEAWRQRQRADDLESKAVCQLPLGIEKQVCTEIAQRQQLGIAKYGTTVADNPLSLREWLMHAYQESLDQAIYLRRAIAEIDAKEYGD